MEVTHEVLVDDRDIIAVVNTLVRFECVDKVQVIGRLGVGDIMIEVDDKIVVLKLL